MTKKTKKLPNPTAPSSTVPPAPHSHCHRPQFPAVQPPGVASPSVSVQPPCVVSTPGQLFQTSNPNPLGRPSSRPLISHAVYLNIQSNIETDAVVHDETTDSKYANEAHFVRGITYMVVLRAELSKQYAYDAVLAVAHTPSIYRHKIKAHTTKLMSMIAQFDRMIANIATSTGSEDGLTLEYYDGLTDHFVKQVRKLLQTAYFSIMQAITSKADLPAEHIKVLSSCHLAHILLNYSANRLEREISHYSAMKMSLSRLRYLSNRPLYQRFDMFNDLVTEAIFPKSAQCDLNADKGVVIAVKNLLSKISNATFVTDTIASYNEIFTREYGQ